MTISAFIEGANTLLEKFQTNMDEGSDKNYKLPRGMIALCCGCCSRPWKKLQGGI